MSNVFGLDIGTRNVVGTVGYQTDDEEFIVIAQYVKQHETRAMLDGQIHDIARVARTIGAVKSELEKQTGKPLTEVCIAAAGRVLKTVTTHVEYEYAEEAVVTGEDTHTLNLLGIEKAQEMLNENNDTKYRFYCVGYSVVKYYLNDEPFISLEDHKASKIGEDIIVTFLPEDVVDGLYAAVGHVGLTVANMTLEPIAAINVAIPENYRMLNIALVDVGAGTSDISLTRDGSIIAYGMIPHAGDELTEVLVQYFLVDFKTAEVMKLASTSETEVTYKDIMSISHTVPAEEVWEVLRPVVEKIATEVAAKIKELNGDKTVSACFVVGGGGKVHGFTEKLAEELELPQERVALRGEEVLSEVVFQQEEIEKDPLLVTPIGICLNYYEQKNNFIMVRFNGERLKLYDNNRLTVVDAALQAGFPNDQLFPKRGMPINFKVDGATRIVRGEAGEPAIVTMNGKPAHINTPLEPNCDIEITPSTAGQAAVYTISQLDEYKKSTITFEINGFDVACPKFVQVNGSLEPGSYEIQEGDEIEMRNFYTVGQIAAFMDLEVDEEREILVNNREATMDTLVYENFSVEWYEREWEPSVIQSHKSYRLEAEERKKQEAAAGALVNETKEETVEVSEAVTKNPETVAETNVAAEDNAVAETNAAETNTIAETNVSNEKTKEAAENTVAEKNIQGESQAKQQTKLAAKAAPEQEPLTKMIVVLVNGEKVELIGKESYIFVDIFDRITFDLQAGRGRAIATLINGREAQFQEEIHNGDQIELYWKEN